VKARIEAIARARAVRSGAVVLFVAVLLASRGCGLGSKPLHHDESLFGYYGYFFATTGYYEYDPVLHGPLLIELTAGIFHFLGDSDLTLRLVSFFSGLVLFPLVLALRPWLGPRATLLALLMMLFSPDLCYYSRFLRNDLLFLALTAANLVAIAHALKRESAWPLVLWPVSFALLISTKENVAFLAVSQLGFALLWIALDDGAIRAASRGREFWPSRPSERLAYALKVINISLLFWCVVAWLYAYYVRPKVPLGWWARVLWLIGVATTAALLDAVLRALRDNPRRVGLVFALYRRIYTDPYWWIAGIALAIAVLCYCYSICLTQPRPIFGLIKQAVAYWWGEHSTERLGGPFHTYAPQILLYEVPAWAIVAGALGRDWWVNRRRRRLEIGLWLAAGLVVWATSLWPVVHRPGDAVVAIQGGLDWTLYDWLTRRLRDYWSYLHVWSLGELFWAASVAYWGGIWTVRSLRGGRLVRGWFVFWLATSYLFYGYAGEKVPWLALHIILPLLLLAAVLWDEWAGSCTDGRRRILVSALLGALLAWSAWAMFLLCFVHPTAPAEIAVYNHTQDETKWVAEKVNGWIRQGLVEPSRIVVQGEASWPLIWYFRRSGEVRFVSDEYRPTAYDDVIIGDPWMSGRFAMLRHDFAAWPFALRSAWVPPAISFNEILCLKKLPGEPDRFAAKLEYRFRNSLAIQRALARYVLFRKAFGILPPPPDDEPFGTVYSMLWTRRRASPEPLLPPPPEASPTSPPGP